jgi:hypothetical protein
VAQKHDIREGLEVLGSDGGMVGRVKGLHGDHIHVEPTAPVHSGDHTVPLSWVVRADDHVHLDREAALVRDTWGSGHAIPPERPAAAPRATAAHREVEHESGSNSWIVWAIGGLLLLFVLFLGIKGCGYAASDSNMEQPNVDAPMPRWRKR